MRDLYASCRSRVGAAHEAGVPIYAGTDAGGMIAHGRIADEIEALKGIGMSPDRRAGRGQLGRPGLAGPARTGARGVRRPGRATPRIRATAGSATRIW